MGRPSRVPGVAPVASYVGRLVRVAHVIAKLDRTVQFRDAYVRPGSARRMNRHVASVVAATLAFSILLGLAATAAQAGDLVQYGSENPTGLGTARGIGSTIDVKQLFPPDSSWPNDKYYWPGVTFSNGIFFQVGFWDSSAGSSCQNLGYFAWSFDGAGNTILSQLQDCVPLAPHYFTMTNVGGAGNGNYYWQAQVGSTNIGPRLQTSSAFPLSSAGVVSEVSAQTTRTSNPPISSVRYDPAVRFKFADGTWHDQVSGSAYRANVGEYNTPCPPYRVGSGAFNTVVTTDSGTITCKKDGDPLW